MNDLQAFQFPKMLTSPQTPLKSFALLLAICIFCFQSVPCYCLEEAPQHGGEAQTDEEPSATVKTKFLYEGPDGCSSDDCYCTTESRIERTTTTVNHDGAPIPPEWITVKTLKCENMSAAGIAAKLASKISSAFKEMTQDAFRITRNIWTETINFFSNIYQESAQTLWRYRQGAPVYYERIKKNIATAYQYGSDQIGQSWEKLKTSFDSGTFENKEIGNNAEDATEEYIEELQNTGKSIEDAEEYNEELKNDGDNIIITD